MPSSDTAPVANGHASPIATLLRGLGVVLVCLVAYVLLLGLLTLVTVDGGPLIGRIVPLRETGGWGFSLERFREADKSGPVDIVVLGASQAFCSLDPRWIKSQGYSSMILGSQAQVPSHTLPLVHKYIERLRPRLVIFIVAQEVMRLEGLESLGDLAGNVPLDRHIVGMAADSPSVTSFNVIAASAIGQFFRPLAKAKQRQFPLMTYVPGGYTENTAPFRGEQYWNASNLNMLPEQLEAVRQVMRVLADRHIPCVAVSVPITPDERSHVLNYDKNASVLAKLAADAGVPYKDFNYSMNLAPPQDFFDDLHLSAAGAAKTQVAVFEWIQSLGMLPPKKVSP